MANLQKRAKIKMVKYKKMFLYIFIYRVSFHKGVLEIVNHFYKLKLPTSNIAWNNGDHLEVFKENLPQGIDIRPS